MRARPRSPAELARADSKHGALDRRPRVSSDVVRRLSCIVLVLVPVSAASCGGKIAELGSTVTNSTPRSGEEDDQAREAQPRPSEGAEGREGGTDFPKPDGRAPSCAKLSIVPQRAPVAARCARWSTTDRSQVVNLSADGRTAVALGNLVRGAVRADLARERSRVYFEARVAKGISSNAAFGLATPGASLDGALSSRPDVCIAGASGIVSCAGAPTSVNGIVWTADAIVSIAADLDARRASFAVDGIWLGCTSALGEADRFPLPEGRLLPVAILSSEYSEGDALEASFDPVDLAFAPPPGYAPGFCEE